MTILELFAQLSVAGVCGSIAQSLAGYSHGGDLASIALGFMEALTRMWLVARMAGLPELLAITISDRTFLIVWSVIGGALLSALLIFLSRPRFPPASLV